MSNKWIMLFLVLVMMPICVGAAEYCPSSFQTSSVYVQYANNTPALEATVTLTLWNGSDYVMENMGSGVYNYSYYVPAYNSSESNTYINLFNSSNPTTNGAEEFTIKSTCATTDGSTSYLPVIIAIGILICGIFYLGLTLAQDHYPLKLFLIWVGIWLFYPLSQLISLIASVESLDPRIYDVINLFPYVILIMAMLVTLYFMYLIVWHYLNMFQKKPKNMLRT